MQWRMNLYLVLNVAIEVDLELVMDSLSQLRSNKMLKKKKPKFVHETF